MTTTPNRQTAILITADWVIAYDPATDSHVEIANGAVLVRGERIDRVGRRSDLANVLADKRIDLGAAVLMPGLIDLDALTDIDHLILDSWASGDAAKSLTWSSSYFDSPRAVFTQQQRLQVRHYGLVQLALHGITTYMPIASEVHSDWAETREDMLAMGRASSELGLRGFLGPSFRSGVNVVDASGRRGVRFKDGAGEAGLREALDFVDDLATLGDPLLTGVLLPCRIETLTPMVLREVARAASDRWLLVRLHALQGMAERTIIDRLYDCTPLQLLEWAGLLSDRLIIPHGIVLDVHPDVAGVDRGDLSVLARAGVSIVHCPHQRPVRAPATHVRVLPAGRDQPVPGHRFLPARPDPRHRRGGLDGEDPVRRPGIPPAGRLHRGRDAGRGAGAAPPRSRPHHAGRAGRPGGVQPRRRPLRPHRGSAADAGAERHRPGRHPDDGRGAGGDAGRPHPRRRPGRGAPHRPAALRADARGLPAARLPPPAGGTPVPAGLPAPLRPSAAPPPDTGATSRRRLRLLPPMTSS